MAIDLQGIPADEVHTAMKSLIDRGIDPLQDEPPRKGKPMLSLADFESWLHSRSIKVRRNAINGESIITGLPDCYDPELLNATAHIILHDELKHDYRCTKDLVSDLLVVVGGKHRFNPVTDMLSAVLWDGVDRLPEVNEILGITGDPLSEILVKKWFLQGVAMAYNRLGSEFGADGMLVLNGPQGCGKTSFVRAVGMRPEFVKLGQYLDPRDKDTSRRCLSAWIVELGEVETTLRGDLERLKAFITAERDEFRLPYAKADQIQPRRTALIATCNTSQFLIDPTGSRRFWTVPVEHIDLDALSAFDWLQLWAQAKNIVDHNGLQCFRLTHEEQNALARRNGAHEKPLKAQPEIEDILESAYLNPNRFEWKHITVSQFKEENPLLRNYTVEQIAKALDKVGIQAERKTIDKKQVRARLLPTVRYSASYRCG